MVDPRWPVDLEDAAFVNDRALIAEAVVIGFKPFTHTGLPVDYKRVAVDLVLGVDGQDTYVYFKCRKICE